MSSELVSVIMGVYYHRDTLELLKRAVESILKQTYQNIEFLICDNGSTSAAMQCLEQYAMNDQRIKLVRDVSNTDLASKLNACLRDAKGTYIARMDDDDYAYSIRLERQVSFLKLHPDIDFVGSNVLLRRQPDLEIIGKRVFPKYPVPKDFFMSQPYIHPSLMFRREALIKVCGYSERPHQRFCEDYDLLLRMYGAQMRGANLQTILLDYSIPATAKGSRKMAHRWNEVCTRWCRFQQLHLFPGALPYVVKPLLVGMLPEKLLKRLKRRYNE